MEVTRIADLPPKLYEVAEYIRDETRLCERVHKDTGAGLERKWGGPRGLGAGR
jgi:hypothetical protein